MARRALETQRPVWAIENFILRWNVIAYRIPRIPVQRLSGREAEVEDTLLGVSCGERSVMRTKWRGLLSLSGSHIPLRIGFDPRCANNATGLFEVSPAGCLREEDEKQWRDWLSSFLGHNLQQAKARINNYDGNERTNPSMIREGVLRVLVERWLRRAVPSGQVLYLRWIRKILFSSTSPRQEGRNSEQEGRIVRRVRQWWD